MENRSLYLSVKAKSEKIRGLDSKKMGLNKWNLNVSSSPEVCMCLNLHLFDKKVLVFTNQVVKYFCQMITLGADEGKVKCFSYSTCTGIKFMKSNLVKYIKTPDVFIRSDLVIKVVPFKGEISNGPKMYPRTRSYPYHLNTAKSWNDLNYFTVTIWRQTLWFIHRICKNLKIRFSRNSESYGKFYNSKFCVFFVFFFSKKSARKHDIHANTHLEK